MVNRALIFAMVLGIFLAALSADVTVDPQPAQTGVPLASQISARASATILRAERIDFKDAGALTRSKVTGEERKLIEFE